MSFKESFYAMMNFEKPELPVQFEWGYWDETIKRWRKEGLPANREPWEDMAFKNGPLISPDLFREFMLPYYKNLTSYLRSKGIKWIILDSDGNIEKLIPLFMEGGVDGLLPFECAAGLDIREVRKAYPDLRILGGIDKMEIAKGKEAIDRELEKKLPFMFSKGGYLPTLDHHVPPEISYENFKYYLEKTRELYVIYK